MIFLHTKLSEIAAMFFSPHTLGFTHIDKFSLMLTHFSKIPFSFPIIPIVKSAKLWVHLETFAHIERQKAFSIETLCNYTLDTVV